MSGGTTPRLLPVRRQGDYDWRELLRLSRREGHAWVQAMVEELGDEEARDPRAGLWVVVQKGYPLAVGGVDLEVCTGLLPAARLVGIYVHPASRGRGHGQRLLGRILRHLRGRFARLTARAGGKEAAGFLEHHGFVPLDHPCVTHFRPVGRR